MGRKPTNQPAAAVPVAQPQPDKSVRRAIGIIASYLAERDQVKPHGPDSDIYWLAREFAPNEEAGNG